MFDQYIRQYGKRLYGLCLSLCASTHDADDLYQDTWLRALQSFAQYDASRAFEPWLTKICINTYRNALRRIARSPFVSFSSTDEQDALLQSVPAPEKPDYSALHAAINTLPDKLRLAVIAFYFQDMDLAATAQTLSIPLGTVKSRLSKARKILKEALHDEPDIRF